MTRIQPFLLVILIFITLLFGQCDDFPKDPEKTLESVRGDTFKVGITENKPWTDLSDTTPKGIEVKLLEVIAQDLQAEIEWKQGSETDLIDALKAHKLHLVFNSSHTAFCSGWWHVSL